MKETPIFFREEMVKAILDGTKTTTRQAVHKNISNQLNELGIDFSSTSYTNPATGAACTLAELCHFGIVGDWIWVKETWRVAEQRYRGRYFNGIQFKADEPSGNNPSPIWMFPHASYMRVSSDWISPVHLPRWAALLFLQITSIKVEKLQDITEEDAKKEGVPDEYPMSPVYCPNCRGNGTCGAVHPVSLGYMEIDCPECDTAKKRFRNLWDSINGRKPGKTWQDNPWVWVIEFSAEDEQ